MALRLLMGTVGSFAWLRTIFSVKESLAKAVAAYEATASNQISLKVGDIVKIRSTSPAGWWEGEVDREGAKHTGWFPGNYVQVGLMTWLCAF